MVHIYNKAATPTAPATTTPQAPVLPTVAATPGELVGLVAAPVAVPVALVLGFALELGSEPESEELLEDADPILPSSGKD